jgi:hypothetical protein
LAGRDGSTGGKRDELLLRTPADLEHEDEIRLERIQAEVERGFDALRDVDDGVSIFGSPPDEVCEHVLRASARQRVRRS